MHAANTVTPHAHKEQDSERLGTAPDVLPTKITTHHVTYKFWPPALPRPNTNAIQDSLRPPFLQKTEPQASPGMTDS